MKKFKYISLLPVVGVLLFGGMLTSCDNDDFSNLHTLTDAELAEMERQRQLAEEMKNRIDADLVLDYELDAYPMTNFDAKALELDMAPVAELFGLSVEEIYSGINKVSGAPEIQGFAIQGTTHADYMVASNTNGEWGHWWRFDGDVCGTYNEDASRFYCEWQGYYDEEKGENVECHFNVGQLPDKCAVGDSFTVLEGLRYKEKRVVFRIKYNIIERQAVVAGVVNTQKLTIEMTPDQSYKPFKVEFDLDKALSDLNTESLVGLDWIGLNADGSYAQEYTADKPGFWFDKSGYPGSWGDDASVWVTYVEGETDPNHLIVGQMPGNMNEGDQVVVSLGVTNGSQIEMFEITCKIIAYQDPETAPAGDPKSVSKDITFTKAWTDDYATVDEDVKELLRDAFKMTTYQIFKALQTGDLKAYIGEASLEDPAYTGGTAGEYWLDAAGKSTDYGNGYVYTGLDASETDIHFYAGNHPQIDKNGGKVTYKYVVICNGGSVTFNVTFDITPVQE